MARMAIIAAGTLLIASPIPALPQPPEPAIAFAADADSADRGAADADAVEMVRRSAVYMRSLPAFALDAEMAIDAFDEDDNVVREAHSLHYEFSAPSGLFVDWRSNGESRQLFFNGSTVSFFLPDSGAYVTLPEEGTAGYTLIEAAEQFGIVVPLPDPYLWTIDGDEPEAIENVRLVGRETIEGVETDHIVLRQAEVDWEIWIDHGENPLPRRILITSRDDPDRPQFAASLRWNTAPRIARGRFTFRPPAGARRIEDEDAPTSDIAFHTSRVPASALRG